MKEKLYNILVYFPRPLVKSILKIWTFLRWYNTKKNKYQYNDYFKLINYQNIKFYILISSKNGFIDNYIHQHSIWEKEILNILKKYLNKDSVFVDIGANIGFHSLFASQICKKVIAFEPISFLNQQFSKSIKKNKINNIDLKNLACGNKEEVAIINISENNVGGSSILNKSGHKKEKIKIIIPDQELEKEKVDFIKIDVEGLEPEVFEGLSNLIEKQKPIIAFEYSPGWYEKRQENLSLNLLKKIKNWNYKLIYIKNNQEIKNFKKFNRLIFLKNQADILCLPK